MIIFNFVIRTASSVKKSLETAVERVENGDIVDSNTFFMVVGMYESRRFGICSYRAKTTDFIDKLTDRFIEAKKSKMQSNKKDNTKWGDSCKSCGNPAYNDRGNGYCYCCDPMIFD